MEIHKRSRTGSSLVGQLMAHLRRPFTPPETRCEPARVLDLGQLEERVMFSASPLVAEFLDGLPGDTPSQPVVGDAAALAMASDAAGQFSADGMGPSETSDDANPVAGAATSDADFILTWENDGDAGAPDAALLGPADADVLWLSTRGDVQSPESPGLDSWDRGEIIEFGDPDLTFDAAGVPANTTDGNFSSVLNLDSYAADGDVSIEALHYVTTDLTVGGTDSFDLKVGDLLLSNNNNETMGGLFIEREDVYLFRPDTPGDYRSGSIVLLLDNLNGNVTGISLVERDTTVGDVTLSAGTFLFSNSATPRGDVYHFTADNVGVGTTSGTTSTLIDGSDININRSINGLELIEETMTIGGTTLQSGYILLSVRVDDNSVGNNSIAVDREDLFYLDVTSTGMGSTAATATLFFDGSDVGLDSGPEDISAVTLAPCLSLAPTIRLPGGAVDYLENDPPTVIDATATVSDPDSVDFDTGTLAVSFTSGGTANDRLAIRNQGSGAGQIGVSGGNVTYQGATIGTFSGGTSGNDPLVIMLNANADQAATEALAQNIVYENRSEDPSTIARTVRFVLTDGDGRISNPESETINVTTVNDAPVLDLDADDSSGQIGADFATSFFENAAPVAIADSDAMLADVDSPNLTSLVVTITNRVDGASELLSADTTGTGITAAYNGALGVLTLGGSDSVANYRQVLGTIRYENTSENPNTTARLITFVAHDGTDAGNVATTTVTVNRLNDAPVANGEEYAVNNSDTLIVSAPGLLANDTDADSDTLMVVLVTDISNGTLAVNPDGSFTYIPNVNLVGIDRFTYRANDGAANSEIATVTIAVRPAVGPLPEPPLEPPPDDPGNVGEPLDDPEPPTVPTPPEDEGDDTGDTGGENGPKQLVPQDRRHGPPRDHEIAWPDFPEDEAVERVSDSRVAGTDRARELRDSSARSRTVAKPQPDSTFDIGSLRPTELIEPTRDPNLVWDDTFPDLDLLWNEADAQPKRDELEARSETFIIGSASVMTAALSAGYLFWTLRGGYLLASFLSSVPAWRMIDPLPILEDFYREPERAADTTDENDESLQSLVKETPTEQTTFS